MTLLLDQQYPLAMLNEKYARLAQPKTFQERFSRPVRAVNTLGDGIFKKEASDAALAELEDSLKRGGGIAIATLATLGAANRLIGVGEYMGFATWFLAMALTPRIVNGMVWMKTGIDLNQEYINTQGLREPLFKDNKYLPLHLIDDERMHLIADRLGIPRGIPDRRRLTEEKVGQVAVQARTAWMLLAGPATPVISGLLCDSLQDHVAGAINRAKSFYHRFIGLPQALNARVVRPEDVSRQVELYIEQKIGENGNSQLSRWWKGFGEKITSQLGLNKAFTIKDVVDTPNQEALLTRLTEYLDGMRHHPEQQHLLEHTLTYLEQQAKYLQTLEEGLMASVEQYQNHLGPVKAEAFREQISARIVNASTTLNHYRRTVQSILKGGSKSEIRTFLEKPVLGELEKLFNQGLVDEIKKLIGNDSLYRDLRQHLQSGRYRTAFNLLGAAPGDHLLDSMKSVMLRRLWKNRVVYGLGGGMLLATALYNYFFVGRNFGNVVPTDHQHGEAK